MPAYDLELGFEGDKTFKVFCDQSSDGSSEQPNYTVFSAGGFVSVGRGGVLSCSPAKP